MNKVILLVALALSCIGCQSQNDKTYHNKSIYFAKNATSRIQTVRTTAYSHTESDHRRYGRKSAVGSNLVYSPSLNSAAADWSEFPVGTKFKIKGYPKIYVIDDYGSALVGTKTIDIYRPNKQGIRNWGVRFVDIEIIEWGCLNTSKSIIQDRLKFAHIRKMYRSIENKLLN